MISLFIPGEPQTKFHYVAVKMNKPPGAYLREFDGKTDSPTRGIKGRWKSHVIGSIKAFLAQNRTVIFGAEVPTILEIWTYIPRPVSYASKVKYHTKKKDTSNFAYFIENMLSGLLCDDDGQHVDLHWHKRLADENHPSGVFIKLYQAPQEPTHPLMHENEQAQLSL